MDQETLQWTVTVLLLLGIAGFFYYYRGKAKELQLLCSRLKPGDSDPLQKILKIKTGKLSDIARDYQNTINVKMPDGMKTGCPSAEYFSADAVSWAAGINLRILNAAAGILVGLGLLGTFIGLVVGLYSFDLTDSGTILANLRQLTSGMWTAFITSVVGMGCSIYFLHYYKSISNEFRKQLRDLTEKLDWAYYVDDANLFAEVLREQLEHVQDPVSALVREVVDDLKTVMNGMISDFKAEVAGAARAEFETLTDKLKEASETMAAFPAGMQKVSDGLPGMIASVTQANEETMRKAQDAAALLGNKAAEISESMRSKADELAAVLAEREKEITDLQTKAATRIKAVLGGLDQSIGKLAEASTAIAGSTDLFVKAQSGISDTTSSLQSISGDMRASLDSFRAAQQDFSENMGRIQKGGQDSISKLSSLLDGSRSLTEDSAREFGTIKDGLKDLFAELQKDLTEYSKTVRESTQTFLDQYTDSLTKTAGALSDTVQRLTDTLGKGRK